MMSNNFILLADDDVDDQELIQLAISKLTDSYHIEVVNNGQEVLDALRNKGATPCLIVLDMNMPIMNGLQTLIALNNEPRYQKVPKIIFTTSDSEDNKRKSLRNGATDYIVKPASMNEFVNAAAKMLSYCH